jgi:hypothetical protein
MGLDTSTNTNLWRDKALVEVNIAVLHSFYRDNASIVDHHSASEQFLKHLDNENKSRYVSQIRNFSVYKTVIVASNIVSFFPTLIPLSEVGTTCFLSCCDEDSMRSFRHGCRKTRLKD